MPHSRTPVHRQADHSKHTGLRLEPFAGVFYNAGRPGAASAFIASSTEAGEAARRESDAFAGLPPHHVLRLVLPHEGFDHDDSGRLLRAWLPRGVLRADTRPALYAYEQREPSGAVLRGLIGALRGDRHPTGGVAPHEDVAADVVDRLTTMLAGLRADVEPLLLWYRGTGTVASVIGTATERPPLLEAVTGHGTVHRLWAVTAEQEITAVQRELAVSQAVIADGHHRFAAHTRLSGEARPHDRPAGFWDHVLALVVDTEQHSMTPRAIHHVVRDVPLPTALDRLGPAHPYEICEGTLAAALTRLAAHRDRRIALLSDGERHCLTHLGPTPPEPDLTDAELAARHLLPRIGGTGAPHAEAIDSAAYAAAEAGRAGGSPYCSIHLTKPTSAAPHSRDVDFPESRRTSRSSRPSAWSCGCTRVLSRNR
ncbi:DUF1015 family protein [Streptomyces sp. HD]|uniref:DUF1015 family protein n=1 Tax=Streptomyces sp. HD TaxID=3020892 RepID=UPI00232BCB52|nr:DUF1015 family protein [Streptomyces sp. HD]MDC0770836.1 DUF1015 family protein [Streptomyces sp. HD]